MIEVKRKKNHDFQLFDYILKDLGKSNKNSVQILLSIKSIKHLNQVKED